LANAVSNFGFIAHLQVTASQSSIILDLAQFEAGNAVAAIQRQLRLNTSVHAGSLEHSAHVACFG
jgi:hypothetical protein